jgi:hypothetical protein
MRTKVLVKHGHTDIELVELSEAVTKYEGIKTIQSLPEFGDAASQSAIAEYLEEKAPKAKSGPAISKSKAPAKTTAPKAAKAPAKAKTTAPVAVTEDEDAPF